MTKGMSVIDYELDDLTNLYNQKAFYIRTRELLNSNKDGNFIICAVDIDKFKVINDLFGTKAGDAVLRYLARSLKDFDPDNRKTIIGRMHADNFMICIADEGNTEKEIADYLDKKMENYALPFRIYVKCGVYRIHNLGIPIEIMCDRANMALDGIKGIFTENCAVYDEKLRNKILQEQEINNEMIAALNSNQFTAYYQPKYNMESGKVIGAEALVRWEHPIKGLISPGVFIPIFEKNGFIINLDRYIWERVCADISSWIKADYGICPISVNVSRVELYDRELPKILKGLVEKYNIPIGLLQLEITESAYTDSPDQMIAAVNKLKEEGFTILMDDFGSGYSSLNTLKDIPIDVLKLDLKFLYKSDGNKKADSILKSVVQMAKRLSLSIIAEGVEDKNQVEFLKSIGCIKAQGYYYSKPIRRTDFEELLKIKEDVLLKDDNYLESLINVDDIMGRFHREDEVEWYRSAVILMKGRLYEYDIQRDLLTVYDMKSTEESSELQKYEIVNFLSDNSLAKFIFPDDCDLVREHFAKHASGRIEARVSHLTPDNGYRWYSFTDHLVTGENGEHTSLVGVLVDVSNANQNRGLVDVMTMFESYQDRVAMWTDVGKRISEAYICDRFDIEFPNIVSKYENPGMTYTRSNAQKLYCTDNYSQELLDEMAAKADKYGIYETPFVDEEKKFQYVSDMIDGYMIVISFVYKDYDRMFTDTDRAQAAEVCHAICAATDNFVRDKVEQQNAELYRNAFNDSRIRLRQWDVKKHTLMRSDVYAEEDGYGRVIENVPESMLETDYIHPDFRAEYKRVFDSLAAGNEEVLSVKIKMANGCYKWMYVDYKLIRDADGNPLKAIGAGEDVNAIFDAQTDMRKRIMVEKNIIPGVLSWINIDITDDKIIGASGDVTEHRIGSDSASALIEHIADEHVVSMDRDEYLAAFAPDNTIHQIMDGRKLSGCWYRMRMDDGSYQWRETNADLYQSRIDGHFKMFAYIRNIDFKVRCQEMADLPVGWDPILRVYRTDFFRNMIDNMLSKDPTDNGVLMLIDMDQFGIIRDKFGDQYASEVIANIVTIIRATIDSNTLMGQVLSDRFALYIHNYPSMKYVYMLTVALQRRIYTAFHVGKNDYVLSASVGLAYVNEYKNVDYDLLYEVAEKMLIDIKADKIQVDPTEID